MINSISQTPSFGHRCIVVLPANTDLETLYKKVNVKNPNFNLEFVEPGSGKVKLDANEFIYAGKSNIKNTDLAKFIFDDRRQADFRLPEFLKSIFGDSRVVSL